VTTSGADTIAFSLVSGGRLSRLPLLRLAACAMMLAGLGLIAHGSFIHVKSALAQVLLERAFASAQGGVAARPWPWADIRPVARIEAPSLGASAVVLDDANGEALAFGPAHLPGTPMPGEPGTSVFAAHRDTHFSWIGDLKAGDALAVRRIDGTTANFTVRQAWIARYDDSGIDAASDETLLALTTCWPLDAAISGPLRYIVEAVAE